MIKSKKRKFISTAAALAAGTAATAMPLSVKPEKYAIAHQVYFWLKKPGSIEDRTLLIAGIKTLKKIETVREMHVGIVAATEKRSVIDTSWGVSLLLLFDDLTGQASYQTDPIHLEFVKNYSNLWDKVVIYDSEMV